MPTYEYVCQECGHEFEAFQSMTEPPVSTCPRCSGQVKRMISAGAGLIFKGSGFYITDYKKKSSSPASGASGDKGKTGSGTDKNAGKKENTSKPS